MMMPFLWLLILISAIGADGLIFSEEDFSLELAGNGMVEVTGNYHFKTESPGVPAGAIFYPFPVDSTAAFPCSISVAWEGKTLRFSIDRHQKGVLIPLNR